MRVKIKDFEVIDLDKFDCRDDFPNLKETMEININDSARDTLTIMYGDEVMFLAGVRYLRDGVAEAWMLGSDLVEKHKLPFYRTVKGLIEFCFHKLDIHRLQISVEADWKSGTKWATNLGFNYEGLAVAYSSDKKDHHIFARVQ